jgi:hypothetical protein
MQSCLAGAVTAAVPEDAGGGTSLASPEHMNRTVADCTPNRGDRIELLPLRMGVPVRGTVFYSDQLQMLVKWDDGRSESLRRGVTDGFRIVEERSSTP